MKSLPLLAFLLCSTLLYAQTDVITTLTTVVLDKELSLKDKNKKTYSTNLDISIPPDFWNQFERIDAVFISSWIGAGIAGKEQYEADVDRQKQRPEIDPVIYFAEKDPKFFSYPRKQIGFGTELAIFDYNPDSSCLKKYCKGKIAPRGIWPCLITKNIGTTPVNFMYRYALPRVYYTNGKCPKFHLVLRTSAKADTVMFDTKIAITIQGKRHGSAKTKSIDDFLKEAMLKGMQEDGFPQQHARWIVENDAVFFVAKCPICTPVESGMREYINTYTQKESKVPAELLDGLVKGSKEDKQAVFAKIVNRYVDRYFEVLNLNTREKTALLDQLENARKRGMALKNTSFGPFCPSCDGACGKKQ